MATPINPQSIAHKPIFTDKALLQKPAFAGARMWKALFTKPDLGDQFKTADDRHTFGSVVANISQVALRILLTPTVGTALLVVGVPLMAFSAVWNAANVRKVDTTTPQHIQDLNDAMAAQDVQIRQLREELQAAMAGRGTHNQGPGNPPPPPPPPAGDGPLLASPRSPSNGSSSDDLAAQLSGFQFRTRVDTEEEVQHEEEEETQETGTDKLYRQFSNNGLLERARNAAVEEDDDSSDWDD